ncbi:histone H1.8 [Lepus europaeus]|uniref:histone H1.8 n=1 Tax=Lepus europaeus TaxID=9983 RepID=UPI002B4A0DB0|nr:histone H1.8 [Lepus europaeus]
MDPKSVPSDTSTSAAGSSKLPASTWPGCSRRSVLVGRRNPPMLRMVLEALQAGEQRRGTSVVAIKLYILHKYPSVSGLRFKYLLKQALATGVRRGLLTRPLNSKARGATGSFKLVPKPKRTRPRKTSAPAAPRKARKAEEPGPEEPGPEKPREARPGPSSQGQGERAPKKPDGSGRAPPKPGAAKKVPKKGGKAKAKDTEAKVGQARKASEGLDKAMQASASPSMRKGKSKIKGHGQSQGHSKAHGRTSAGSKSSKPTANKVKNGVASPSRKKTTTKAPRGVVPGMGARPKAKATTPSKGPGSKVGPVPLSGKSEGPRSPRKPGLPPKAPASKTSGKKAKAEGSGLG